MSFTIITAASRLLGIPLALVMMLFSITCTGSDATGPESGGGGGSTFSGQIDHTCADLSSIPSNWIDSVKTMKMHYAHTSHGSQLTTGLDLIENDDATYDVEIGSSYLPDVSGALCIFDGQEGDTYISPDMFWETADGMDMTRSVLNNNPSITVCMWCWCTQLDYYGQEEVQAYLDSMAVLESEYPSVTFVYMTGNAQATGSEGYNRYQRNQQIRQYCESGGKILFDFADLDSWWYNSSASQWEQNTYEYSGNSIPLEHSRFNGDEAGHTTYESCRQKGRAVWWMLARIAGWNGS